MKKVLLKDIVIPAGTVLTEDSSSTGRGKDFFECVVGLSPNTHGYFSYIIDGEDGDLIGEHFTDLKE